MKREHNVNEIPFYENLIFFAPLTENSIDIIGEKQSVADAVEYNENGALFVEGELMNYLAYKLTEDELKNVKTIYCEYFLNTDKYDSQTIYNLGTARGDIYTYAQDGVVRNYRVVWHGINNLISKYTSANNQYDIDLTYDSPVLRNVWHKTLTATNADRQYLYDDGIKQIEHVGMDDFANYNLITSEKDRCYLFVGGRTHTTQKHFNGYIRNVMMWDCEFTEEDMLKITKNE